MKERVLVVGAGVIGLSIAWRLKREGYSVKVLAASDPWQASGASAGVLFPTSGRRASGDPGLYNMKALRMWDDFDADLGKVTVRKRGVVMLGNEQELEDLETMARAADLRVDRLSESPPFLHPEQRPKYSLEIKDGRVVDPRKLLRVLKESLGGDVVIERAQRLLLKGERVVGVAGRDEHRAEHTVLALGALGYGWLEEKLRPQVVPLIGEALLLEMNKTREDLPAALYPPGESSGPLLHYGDGSLWWGGSYRRDERIGAKWSEVERIMRRARELFPWVDDLTVKDVLFGVRPVSADGLPFLGPSEQKKGLYIATGHGRDGILQAPLAAEQMFRVLVGDEVDERLLPERQVDF